MKAFHWSWEPGVWLSAHGCRTPFGDATATRRALADKTVALKARAIQGSDPEEDQIPLALIHPMDDQRPSGWERTIASLPDKLPAGEWGTSKRPVIVTSSNFGIDQLLAYTRDEDARRLAVALPHTSAERVAELLGWSGPPTLISHACVSSSLGILQAAQWIRSRVVEEVLVFSFDFVSPFVAAGFASLKILNRGFPMPYSDGVIGSIGLGDAVGWVVVSRTPGPFRLIASATQNEMHHMTANEPAGSGFEGVCDALAADAAGRRLWIKGHGTGTLDAGRLEANAFERCFPGAPLVSWKGSLGHTLGTCGLVETAVSMSSVEAGEVPGTVGGRAPVFAGTVALDAFSPNAFQGFLSFSSAFGGAHVLHLIEHD